MLWPIRSQFGLRLAGRGLQQIEVTVSGDAWCNPTGSDKSKYSEAQREVDMHKMKKKILTKSVYIICEPIFPETWVPELENAFFEEA